MKRTEVAHQIRCMIGLDDNLDLQTQAKLDLEAKWELNTKVLKDSQFWEVLVSELPDLEDRIVDVAIKILGDLLEGQEKFWYLMDANLEGYIKLVKKCYCRSILMAQGRWNSVPLESLYGIFSAQFDDDIDLTRQFIEGFMEYVPEDDFEGVTLDNGKYMVQCKIKLDPSDIEKYRRMGSPYPMLFEPLPSSKHNEGYFICGSKNVTSNSKPMSGREDVLDRLNKCPMYWNHWVLDNYEFPYVRNLSKMDPLNPAWDESIDSWSTELDTTSEIYEEMKTYGLENEPMFAPTVADPRWRVNYKPKVHTQKTEQLKTVIEMESRTINQDGIEGLALAFANALGKDKEPVHKRQEYIFNSSVEELHKAATATVINPVYPKNYQVQGAQDEPTHAAYYDHIWQELHKKKFVRSGVTVAMDAVCQGGALWGAGFQNAALMEQTCLTSKTDRNDMYSKYAIDWFCEGSVEKWSKLSKEEQKRLRQLAKDIFKVLLYGGSQGCRKYFDSDEEFEDVMEKIKRHPVFRTIQRIGKFWNPEWEAVEFEFPDGSKTYIQAKIKEEIDGELVEGETIESLFFEMPISYRILRKGKVDSSASLPPHINHSVDAYFIAESARINLPNWEQVKLLQKIREYRNLQRSNFIAEDLKNTKLTTKKFNPRSKKNKQLMYCLYKGQEINWYSFRILDLLTLENQEMVPDEVLDELYYYVAERSVPMWGIHDSIVCHVNDWKIVQNTYRYLMWRFAESSIYQSFFNQLGIRIRLPHRNHGLNALILKSENLFS